MTFKETTLNLTADETNIFSPYYVVSFEKNTEGTQRVTINGRFMPNDVRKLVPYGWVQISDSVLEKEVVKKNRPLDEGAEKKEGGGSSGEDKYIMPDLVEIEILGKKEKVKQKGGGKDYGFDRKV